jgi:FkbM family methyltransferase
MPPMLSRFNWTDLSKNRLEILRQYEPIQPYLLYALSEAVGAQVFLDIGANIGAYSVLIATLPSMKNVYAFEPAQDTFGELIANARQNGNSGKITSHRVALSDKAGTVSFGVVSALSGANSIVETSIHASDKFSNRIEVPAVTLDEKVPLEDRIIVAKIDVEGHEMTMLRGAVNTLSKNKCLIQIEDYQGEGAGLHKIFAERGYRWMFNVGPDQYFTNINIDDAAIVRAFSVASTAAVAENFSTPNETSTRPVRVTLPFGIGVELSGSVASALRALKRRLKRA